VSIFLKLRFAVLLFCAGTIPAQTEPQPAPANSALILGTCVVANYKGGPEDIGHAGTVVKDLVECKSFDSDLAKQFLAPGEYRVFIHLIGAHDDYIVACLGKITWSTYKGHYSVTQDCVWPGRQRNNPVTGSDPYEVGHAWFAVPVVGNYTDNTWSRDGKVFTIVFAGRTYKEPPRSFKYTLLRKTSSTARIISPNEIAAPYSCPNGELVVEGVKKCRPS
jgi:hypothetical protein